MIHESVTKPLDALDIRGNYKQAMAKLKSFEDQFDKIDQIFAKNAFSIQQLTSDVADNKARFIKLQRERTDKESIQKIQDDFENIQKYTDFAVKDIKQKCIDLQEFLTHYTPLQTHLQVLEAFEFLDCLSSETKLELFKTHKAILLKLNQSKKCSDYYFETLKEQITNKIEDILTNNEKELIDPKLKERVAHLDIDKGMQTDPLRVKFEGKTNFREVWLVRSAKEGLRYTRKWNRYYRYIKEKIKRKHQEQLVQAQQVEQDSDDFDSEESEQEIERELIQEQLQLEEQSIEESVDSKSEHQESVKLNRLKSDNVYHNTDNQNTSNEIEKSKPLSTKSKERKSEVRTSVKERSESINQNVFDEIIENQLKDEYLEAPIDSSKEINRKHRESSSKDHSNSNSRNTGQEENVIQVKISRKKTSSLTKKPITSSSPKKDNASEKSSILKVREIEVNGQQNTPSLQQKEHSIRFVSRPHSNLKNESVESRSGNTSELRSDYSKSKTMGKGSRTLKRISRLSTFK